MKERIPSILLMIVAIYLMTLPYGVAMTFAPGPEETVVRYFSYFSLMSAGYGNWMPIITIVLSAAVTVLLFFKNSLRKTIFVCLGIMILGNLLTWLIFNSLSLVSLAIVVILVLVFIISLLSHRKG